MTAIQKWHHIHIWTCLSRWKEFWSHRKSWWLCTQADSLFAYMGLRHICTAMLCQQMDKLRQSMMLGCWNLASCCDFFMLVFPSCTCVHAAASLRCSTLHKWITTWTPMISLSLSLAYTRAHTRSRRLFPLYMPEVSDTLYVCVRACI